MTMLLQDPDIRTSRYEIVDVPSVFHDGILHFIALGISLIIFALYLIRALLITREKEDQDGRFMYRPSLAYGFALQVLLGASLTLSIALNKDHLTAIAESILLGYIFILQAVHIVASHQPGIKIQSLLRYQVITLIATETLLALVTDVFPLLLVQRHASSIPRCLAKAGILSASLVLIAFTPRTAFIHSSVLRGLESSSKKDGIDDLPALAPEQYCSPFSYAISYGWLTPLIWKGCRRSLTMDDLPPLPWYDEPTIWRDKIFRARQRGVTTLKTIVFLLHREITAQAVLATTTALVEFVAPFAMYNLLAYLQSPKDAVLNPYVWILLLFLGPTARSVSYQQYIFTSTRLIVRIKQSFIQEIYHKALGSIIFESLPALTEEETPDNPLPPYEEYTPHTLEDDVVQPQQKHETSESGLGHIVNLMSFDTDAIEAARDIVLISFAVPIEIGIATTFLYKLIGWSAFIGLGVMTISLVLPMIIAHRMVQAQQKVLEKTDKRISMISEYLSSMRIIKYFGWETAIAANLKESRQVEQARIWRRNLWNVAVIWSGDFIPLFTLLVIFTSFTLSSKEPLQAATAFTCLSIIETLRQQFTWVSNVSGFISQAVVSIRRIDKFFRTAVPKTEVATGNPSFKDATLLRSPSGSFRLQNINVDFLPGRLNVITGPTGSGKTSLLLSLLGETILEKGEITCPRDIAYVSQVPWLWNSTIRDNILFHGDFDKKRYDATVKACGLLQDFKVLPFGDMTEVSEQGAALSGGQRQRVALARAVYSTASTLLLDDVFSALDVTTTNHIFNAFFKEGFLGQRTIILISSLQPVIDSASLVVTLGTGRVLSVTEQTPIHNPKQVSETELSEASSTEQILSDAALEVVPVQKTKLEAVVQGRIPRNLFFKYMLEFGGFQYAILAIMTAFCTQIVFFSMTLWLSVWTGASTKENAGYVGFYLGIYALILLGYNIMSPLNNAVFQYGAWRAARKLHSQLSEAVLNASLRWYDSVPLGTILNRFSIDIDSLDSLLVNWLRMTLDNQIRLCLRIGAIASILPIFALPAAILCSIGFIVGEMYTRAQISIKRLTSATQSPIFAHFSESLLGLPTIRAQAGMKDAYGLILAGHLHNSTRAFEALYNSNRWVSVRADIVAASVAAAAGAIAVVKTGTISAGLVGFSLTNAVGLSQTILSMVRNMNELEVELNCYQRIKEYTGLKAEEKELVEEDSAVDGQSLVEPSASWPQQGRVAFYGFSASYSKDGPEILRNITLETRPGERIGIVGRTGSGKSSLALSLLRFTHFRSGSVFIDGLDISKVGLHDLRQSVTIIPQEPTLFTGDVRSNLDPSGDMDETEIRSVLDACASIDDGSSTISPRRIKEHPVRGESSASSASSQISHTSSGLKLSDPVISGGANFSRGQRQILCMARAICRRSKIVVLDEATSSVDDRTDVQIQEVLRSEFPSSTIFTVAHRLKTIMDYDRILVLSHGEVVELDTPKNLIKKKGTFWEMVQESGRADELVSLIQ